MSTGNAVKLVLKLLGEEGVNNYCIRRKERKLNMRRVLLSIGAATFFILLFRMSWEKAYVYTYMASQLQRYESATRKAKQCPWQRYNAINSMKMKFNDFIPYHCYNHNDRYLTILGMHPREFDRRQLTFKMNGFYLDNLEIYSGHQTFVMNAPISSEMLTASRDQVFTYRVNGCAFTMNCTSYYDSRRDKLNLCVYTKRRLQTIRRFLAFYQDFCDRIFIYITNKRTGGSFRRLQDRQNKFVIIPWYLEDLRDRNISSAIYNELVAHNYRNYSRDAQKVQTNDCMYKNRDTDLLLMVDDDEYLNFHNRKFFTDLYDDIKYNYDDILLDRNYCNTTVAVETRLSAVFKKTTTRCAKSAGIRLEKAFVLPRNCRLYEIHRCVSKKSYSLRHLNIHLAHLPYPKGRSVR